MCYLGGGVNEIFFGSKLCFRGGINDMVGRLMPFAASVCFYFFFVQCFVMYVMPQGFTATSCRASNSGIQGI